MIDGANIFSLCQLHPNFTRRHPPPVVPPSAITTLACDHPSPRPPSSHASHCPSGQWTSTTASTPVWANPSGPPTASVRAPIRISNQPKRRHVCHPCPIGNAPEWWWSWARANTTNGPRHPFPLKALTHHNLTPLASVCGFFKTAAAGRGQASAPSGKRVRIFVPRIDNVLFQSGTGQSA